MQALRDVETEQLEYIRQKIESQTGLCKQSPNARSYPSNTVVVYERYLRDLLSILMNVRRIQRAYNEYPSNVYTRKFYRYCNEGQWSVVESCIQLNCDRKKFTGEPELVLRETGSAPSDRQNLFAPLSVNVIYTYGTDRFCKRCEENGEWSRHSLTNLCNDSTEVAERTIKRPLQALTASLLFPKPKVGWRTPNKQNSAEMFKTRVSASSDEEIYQQEATCRLNNLRLIETQATISFTYLFLVSPDRKRTVNPNSEKRASSRT